MTDKTMEGKELFQKFQRACMERPAPACGFAYDYDGEKSTTNQAVLRKLLRFYQTDGGKGSEGPFPPPLNTPRIRIAVAVVAAVLGRCECR